MARGLTAAGAAAFVAASYVVDVPLRRGNAVRIARAIADVRGGPLLNIGAGTATTAMCGSTLYGDINLDLGGAKGVPHGPDIVTFGDATDLSEFPDGSAPHTWLHPGHRWYFAGGEGRGQPRRIS